MGFGDQLVATVTRRETDRHPHLWFAHRGRQDMAPKDRRGMLPMIKVVPKEVHVTQLPRNGITPNSQARTHVLVFPSDGTWSLHYLCIVLFGLNMRIMREWAPAMRLPQCLGARGFTQGHSAAPARPPPDMPRKSQRPLACFLYPLAMRALVGSWP